jgi:putative transposase
MARANRHHIPGQVWHITHRCHKREFLLKFAKDRRRWVQWLFEAKKRYRLDILNYVVTSNHIHLLVVDGEAAVIPKSLQLVEGNTAQEFNLRKHRKGAFWDDRYHATAVEKGEHLLRCLVYIDLNMVRNGVVKHPAQWAHGGYREIQNPPLRYGLINLTKLIECCGFGDKHELRTNHREWVEAAIKEGDQSRRPEWTESVAVGSEAFVSGVLDKLKRQARGRQVRTAGDHYELREPEVAYSVHFGGKMDALRLENAYLWG